MTSRVAPAEVKNEQEEASQAAAVPSLFKPTADAFFWRIVSVTSKFGLQTTVTIILARLLPVEAFGLLAMAMVVINLAAKMSYLGMIQALIQRREITEIHVRVAFSLSCISGIVLTAVVWTSAPLIAAAFRTEAAVPVIRLMSFWFMFTGFGATASALLLRKLDYRTLLKVEFSSYVFSYVVVGITLALLGYGVWALAWATVTESMVFTALLFLVSRHPARPCFSGAEARELLKFGVGQTLSSFANYAAVNGDYFVVGRWLGLTPLGLYSRAYQLTTVPLQQFSSVISSVLFPVYSMIQDDNERLRRAYLLSVSVSAIVVFPMFATIAIGAPEIMTGVFGSAWAGATIPLEILCIGGAFHSMYNLGDSLASAKGAIYSKFGCHTIYALAVLVLAYLGTRWGITGVSVGVVGALAIMYLLIARLGNRLTELSWKKYFLSQVPGVLVAAAAAIVALPVTLLLRAAHLPSLIVLAGTMAAAACAAIATGIMLPADWLHKAGLTLTKEHLKSILSRNETLYRKAELLYDNAMFISHIVRAGLLKALLRSRSKRSARASQRVLTWNVQFPYADDPARLITWLRSQGVEVQEGDQTFYVPPQEELCRIAPEMVSFYPDGSGFKILKHLSDPQQARYVYKGRRVAFRTRLIGSPQDQLVPSNYMHALGIGPRVWDLTCFEAQGARYTVFVVEHVSGTQPTIEQHADFISRLKHLSGNSHLRILAAHWEETEDFTPPHCQGNLIYSQVRDRSEYVDFQNFILRTPEAWSTEVIASANGAFSLSDRAVSGGEATVARRSAKGSDDKRGSSIIELLHAAGSAPSRRIVLDLACGSGTMLHWSLAVGAAWGVGWDRPDTVRHARDLLLSLGTTRVTLIGVDADQKYRLAEDIPARLRGMLDEALVFYRPLREGLEMSDSLRDLPWRTLVYEGHPSECLEDAHESLTPLLSDGTEVVASSYVTDTDGCVRPTTILLRRADEQHNSALSATNWNRRSSNYVFTQHDRNSKA